MKIAVDGACSGNPGPAEYRGVDMETGKVLFHVNIGTATNNLAEYFAIAHAVSWLDRRKITTGYTIYSDSVTAISWVKNGEVNTSFSSPEITKKIANAKLLLRSWSTIYGIKLEKISGKSNPADFGRK